MNQLSPTIYFNHIWNTTSAFSQHDPSYHVKEQTSINASEFSRMDMNRR